MRPVPGLKVLVTARASGLGAAIALAFHKVWAKVVICDDDRAALDRFAQANPRIVA